MPAVCRRWPPPTPATMSVRRRSWPGWWPGTARPRSRTTGGFTRSPGCPGPETRRSVVGIPSPPRRDRRQDPRRLSTRRAGPWTTLRRRLVRHREDHGSNAVPTLAGIDEVRAVRPDAGPQLAEVLGHPSLVLGELDATAASHVDQLLLMADVFDGCAGHVVHTARTRGWPALSADPGRLRRVDPEVQLDLL